MGGSWMPIVLFGSLFYIVWRWFLSEVPVSEVTMPSKNYRLELENTTVATIDGRTSIVTGVNLGFTELKLKDQSILFADDWLIILVKVICIHRESNVWNGDQKKRYGRNDNNSLYRFYIQLNSIYTSNQKSQISDKHSEET